MSQLLNRSDIRQMAKILSVSLAIYYVINKFYVGFFGPLSKIPGPFITRFMPMPNLLYTVIKGTRFKLFKSLHEKYGRVVRISPTTLSISDKSVLKQILVTDDLTKAPHYERFTGKYPNMFSTRDKAFHRQRRRIVSPAFSTQYLNSLEPFMTSVTQSFVKKINKEIDLTMGNDGFGIVDIWILYQCLALDVIGETAFGQTFDMVENNSHFVPKAISEDLKATAIGNMTPSFIKIFYRRSTDINPKLGKFMRDIIYDRMSVQNEEKKRKDILQWLIDSQKAHLSRDRLNAGEIISETILFLTAGSETTSNTLGFAVYELLCHPEKLRRLYQEIDQVPLQEGDHIFKHEQLKRLEYLNAVINETLRLDTVAAGGLGRVTTEEKTTLGQYVLPKGIVVFANVYDTQTTSDYWERPGDFIPERWLSESNIRQADVDAFHPFSSGSRNCIGKNFALQEMRLALSVLLKHFEIAPIEQELKDAQDRRGFVTLRINKNSFKIKIKRRS